MDVILSLMITILILAEADGTIVINPEQNNTLICSGKSLHYSCHVSGNISITWSVQCPGQRPADSDTFSLRSAHTENNGSLNCNYNNNMFNLDFHFTYATTQMGAHSNVTISVPSLNNLVIKAQSVKIGCEDIIYRYVEVPGLPPSPSNLSYGFGVCNGTHVLTTFNWSNQMEIFIENYVLTLTSTEPDNEDISRSVAIDGNTTSITIPLDYQNMLVYTATVHSSRCGEVSERRNNPSINVTFNQCDLVITTSCLELVPTDYPQLMILNTSNSTLSSYMCMDGMMPEMRMESVCTRNGTWEPDPGQLSCTPRMTEDILMSTDLSPSDSRTTTVIAISITSLLVAVLLCTCGVMTVLIIQRLNKHYRKMRLDFNAVLADDPLPTSVTHTSELSPIYEDILPPEKQKKIEIQENIAYGPVSVASECQ